MLIKILMGWTCEALANLLRVQTILITDYFSSTIGFILHRKQRILREKLFVLTLFLIALTF